jgi:broad specificity phosphatase PhoE
VNTVFHLIRHAAHDQLGFALSGRNPDVRLSDQGRAQASALAKRLSAEPLDAIHASPQPRTRETAAAVAGERAIAVEISEELDEIDFGRWSGNRFEALEGDPDWKRWNEQRGTARTPGGETMREVADRLVTLVERLHARHPGGTVALVSHCDVIKAGLCHYLGLPFERMDRIEVEPASISTLVVGDWGGKLMRLNETCSGPAAGERG